LSKSNKISFLSVSSGTVIFYYYGYADPFNSKATLFLKRVELPQVEREYGSRAP
jgi:hypothetical protein